MRKEREKTYELVLLAFIIYVAKSQGRTNMSLSIFADNDEQDYKLDERSSVFDTCHIPMLPKIGVHTNVHAMIVSSIATMMIRIWSKYDTSIQVNILSCLIPCFIIGVVCGLSSIALGILSIRLSEVNHGYVGNNIVLGSIKSSDILISASLGLMLVSNLIFIGSAAVGLYTIAGVFVRQ